MVAQEVGLEAGRYAEIAIDLLALQGAAGGGLIGVSMPHIERRGGGNVADDGAGARGVVSIDNADGEPHHLSGAKDGGHEEQQKQR